MGFFSFLAPIAKAVAPSLLGGLLGGKDKEEGLQVAVDPYGATRDSLLSWLNPQIGQPGKKYTGEMVAPMSEAEKQSQEYLKKYGNTELGDTFQQAKGEISKTLTNQYDPTTSPYYQAVKAAAADNLKTTKENIASDAAGAGRYWSGARLSKQGDAETQTTLGLNTMLGQLAENERQNRMNVIPKAMQLAEMEAQFPLQKATAYQTLGALPRSIQQALDTATQNEWLRSEVDYPMQIATMAGNIQTPPTYQQPAPSWQQQLMGGLGSSLGTALPELLSSIFKKK